jgi:hypothetical protein
MIATEVEPLVAQAERLAQEDHVVVTEKLAGMGAIEEEIQAVLEARRQVYEMRLLRAAGSFPFTEQGLDHMAMNDPAGYVHFLRRLNRKGSQFLGNT